MPPSQKRPRHRHKDPVKAAVAAARRAIATDTPLPVEDEIVIKEVQINMMDEGIVAMNEMFAMIPGIEVIVVPARPLAADVRKILTSICRIVLIYHRIWQGKARKDLSHLPIFTRITKLLAELNKLRDSLDATNIYFKIREVQTKLDHAYALFDSLKVHWRRELVELREKLRKEKGLPPDSASASEMGAASSSHDSDTAGTQSPPSSSNVPDGDNRNLTTNVSSSGEADEAVARELCKPDSASVDDPVPENPLATTEGLVQKNLKRDGMPENFTATAEGQQIANHAHAAVGEPTWLITDIDEAPVV